MVTQSRVALPNGQPVEALDPAWRRAYERSWDTAVRINAIPGTPVMFHVTSRTSPGTVYRTGVHTCTCSAGRAGIPCLHRAAVLARLNYVLEDAFPFVWREKEAQA